jgi:glycosyltransferase involved in cell wall biosynthesis
LGYNTFPYANPWRQRLFVVWGTRWSVAAATAVIAVSQATANDLERITQTPLKKIHVIHEAANALPIHSTEELAAFRQRIEQQCGLRRPYALYVGTLQPRKNLVRLMSAYEQLFRRGEVEFDLVLAGRTGWLSDELLAQAKQSPQAERIHLPGFIADEELPLWMAGALFFAFPSLYEGFGLPILEAQSLGVAVMTAKGSSLPEVAGDAALYVDPTDVEAIAQAMLRLSQDETLRQELIAAGYRNMQRFSWDKAAAETLAVLEEAAQQGR